MSSRYYLTIVKEDAKGAGKYFISEDEAMMAYQNKIIELQAPIQVRRTVEYDGKMVQRRVETTVGKIIFNRDIPQNIGFIDRTNPDNIGKYEIDFLVTKKKLDVMS